MSVGLILPPANISPATEAGHTFAMLLLQKGKNYYNTAQTASTFDTIEAVKAFEEWTDFYTKYSFVQSYDAYSRFRTGEYPMVIANYTFSNQLAVASPEIKGLWDFCPVPGTLREDGTVIGENTRGTWETAEGTYYLSITIGETEYSGVFCAMNDEAGTPVMTFSAVGNNESIWGVKYLG
jgi:hypothetical protein